ncbi:uncharacterized protein F4807DRAFT_464510 [Annulohypoxylon truncatum]|uniref:uncharacterized protein n=1 Tax=Annulohypoxylon truncatum TaxID=327061 RepID=UPI002008DB72|nr:uncharacterized protein F4807DRAFT_464510 [Annulohypoxylon truncatum]KAI1205629.1 hypothetical protein F4807DRAFT_464510 [Annulohypoxylon truncatum]
MAACSSSTSKKRQLSRDGKNGADKKNAPATAVLDRLREKGDENDVNFHRYISTVKLYAHRNGLAHCKPFELSNHADSSGEVDWSRLARTFAKKIVKVKREVHKGELDEGKYGLWITLIRILRKAWDTDGQSERRNQNVELAIRYHQTTSEVPWVEIIHNTILAVYLRWDTTGEKWQPTGYGEKKAVEMDKHKPREPLRLGVSIYKELRQRTDEVCWIHD